MASTYVNDLRLNEMGTGDASGTWGTNTNVNLELIGEALGFGTEGITTNADTHTSTIADGATDPVRAMYVKYTGTLDSACTITIAPNTVNRMQFIENGTSGSQNIIISQGSGANITIPAGDTKAVYLDGAGSGAAVVDAFASLNVVDLKVQDDLTVTDDLIVNGDIDLEGAIDVNGTANLDVVDIDGAVDMASTLTVAGVVDVTDTTDSSDASGDTGALRTEGGASIAKKLYVGTDLDVDGTANLDVVDIDGAVDMATTLAVAGNVDFNGDLDVDGTTNLDVVDIDGAVDMASTLAVAGDMSIAANIIHTGDTDTSIGFDTNTINFTTGNVSGLQLINGVNYMAGTPTLPSGSVERSYIYHKNVGNTSLHIGNQYGADAAAIHFETRNTVRASIMGSGGLTFNGDTAAANALDDYEEGSWTPVCDNVTTNSSSMYGIYTKIGNICHVHCKIDVTVASLPGAQFNISGLPFAAKESSDAQQRAILAVGGDMANMGSNATHMQFRTNGSVLQGVWINSGATNTWTYNLQDSTSFQVHVHGFYTV